MKIFTLLIISILTASCGTVKIVSNRDSTGKFITPTCPQCGQPFTRSATVYQCNNMHLGASIWTGQVAEGGALAPKLSKAPW